LSQAKPLEIPPVLAGFDGFVDTILHAVAERHSSTEYTRLLTIKAFSERILDGAGGRNLNIEMAPRFTKIGGNGPILAQALARFGMRVNYIGCLGSPQIHPVFAEFTKLVNTFSIAEPGYSDAIEFTDGKLICGKQQSVTEISWQLIVDRVPIEQLSELVAEAELIAFLNWGIIFSMTEIMQEFLQQIAERLSGSRKLLFVDTADPSKRSDEDVCRFIELLPRFTQKFQVGLGFNLRESTFIARVLGLPAPGKTADKVLAYTTELRDRLGIDMVLIHWPRHAVGSTSKLAVATDVPYTESPQINTGAGDHFNAGFCLGHLLGGDFRTNLKLGVATSAYYVHEAKSPTLAQLSSFIETVSQKQL
jgi:hypothetical protein